MIDLRGFGHSGGPRFNSTAEQLHQDIEVLLKQANKDLPLFVLGHSMGGALVATLLTRNPDLNITGVILSSPMFELTKPLDAKKKIVLKATADDLEVQSDASSVLQFVLLLGYYRKCDDQCNLTD